MSARRIDYAQVRTGGHIGPPLRWEPPPAERFTRREVDRAPETRKNFAFRLHLNFRKHIATRQDLKKREVHTTSTQRTACGLQLFEGSLDRYTTHQLWDSFWRGCVRFAATSLESVDLVNKALLERNSDHDAHLERGVGYVRRSY